MIQARELTKSFGDRQVLGGVSLEARPGEVFGFVGPNGAGKTTFLKCLLGISRPDGGEATIDGVDCIRQSLEARRRVGYAPGEISLYNRLRVAELFDFATAFHERVDRAWAEQQMDAFGLPRDRRVGKLSHGMKRQLLVITALAVDTPAVVLDEPMEGLDPDLRRRVEDLLRAKADAGRTVLFSSHDLASVERICEKVAFLRDGKVLETGSIAALLARAARVLTLQLHEPVEAAALPQGPGFQWTGGGLRWQLEFEGELGPVLGILAALPLAGIRDASGGLVEVFDALYGPGRSGEEA